MDENDWDGWAELTKLIGDKAIGWRRFIRNQSGNDWSDGIEKGVAIPYW